MTPTERQQAIDKLNEVKCKCQSCSVNDATEEHTCPYREDIDDDSVTLCNCCKTCMENCADDI